MGARADRVAAAQVCFAAERLEQIFADCFASTFRTQLRGGAQEPLYQPASGAQELHMLYYREDFFASALHEVAHWCIAGPGRRQQLDFGYWYAPDGRSAAQQRAFEAVESRPQALEWFFCKACAYRFRVSADNLDGLHSEFAGTGSFRLDVLAQARRWQGAGLPERAAVFFRGLCREYGTGTTPRNIQFSLAELD